MMNNSSIYYNDEDKVSWSTVGCSSSSVSEREPELQFDFSTELAQYRNELAVAQEKEEKLLEDIEKELSIAFGTAGPDMLMRTFDQSVARLCSLNECIQSDGKQLSHSLNLVSGLADNISTKVAALDQAKGRVVECLQLVNDLKDLRMCADGVQKAIQIGDYDEATQHIHRFLTLDSAVFRVGDQMGSKDPGQSLKHSYEILRNAQAELKIVIEGKFDGAIAKNDEAEIQHYFRLFPRINDHASGLQKFGKHICGKIEQSGNEYYRLMQAGGTDDKRVNVLYADTLTLLLENIARLVEAFQPDIDNFYGPDKLLGLIEIIQVEVDKQASRILAAFLQKRQLDEKIRLVDSFLRPGAKASERIEPRELDALLAETTLMHTRTELYWRFLKRRLGEAPARPLSESHDDAHPNLSPKLSAALEEDVFGMEEMSEDERRQATEKAKAQKKERNKKLDTLLNKSVLGSKMQEILGKYVLLEQYFMTESVRKGITQEEVEEGSKVSSLLDDVFFIVRKSIVRSITSSSVDCVCAVLNNGCTLLETDFFLHINKIIKVGYPSVGFAAEAYQTAQAAYNVLQHGKSVAEAGPDTQRSAFLIALNNMREAVEFIEKLKSGLQDKFEKHLVSVGAVDKQKLANSVSQLDDLCKKFMQTANIGVGKLVDSAFKPKLKSNADAYLNIIHELSEEEFAEFEITDPFIHNFVAQVDKLIAPFTDLLTAENYTAMLHSVLAETSRRLEYVIMQCGFNRTGALHLDREYRVLCGYFTDIAGWSIRDKSARLGQIVGALNLENVDEAVAFFHEMQTNYSVGAGLTAADFKKVLKLRVDFSPEKVNQIKL